MRWGCAWIFLVAIPANGVGRRRISSDTTGLALPGSSLVPITLVLARRLEALACNG